MNISFWKKLISHVSWTRKLFTHFSYLLSMAYTPTFLFAPGGWKIDANCNGVIREKYGYTSVTFNGQTRSDFYFQNFIFHCEKCSASEEQKYDIKLSFSLSSSFLYPLRAWLYIRSILYYFNFWVKIIKKILKL